MNILYSFNKKGYEAACWMKEIAAASNETFTFIPFNHGEHLNPELYTDATKLDRLYREQNNGLMRMYQVVEELIQSRRIDALIVANCPPYHPDFLLKLDVYRALYSADDPGATYIINIPYLHAYHHVFFVAPAYSRDMDMQDKMRSCSMKNADWLPISVFDFECHPGRTKENILSRDRDIDIIYVGGFWRQKIDTLVRVRKAFGKQFRMYGFFRLKHNLYLNIRYGYGGWISPVSFEERVRLYQRSKLGINIHWDGYGLGNQRLYHLPANGVMQLCDCQQDLGRIFTPNEEVVGYQDADDLIEKVHRYLNDNRERNRIAANGYERTMRDYRFAHVTRSAGKLIEQGMERISWKRSKIVA